METNDNLIRARHSLAHLLAIEVLKHDSAAKLAIGPWIDDGFYYDFEFSPGKTPTPEDLAKFEEGMRASIAANPSFTLADISADEARVRFAAQPYKLELVEELSQKGEALTTYQTGDFVDLCAGPHVAAAGEIAPDSFKIDRVAGAYWRGDETKPMLTRIYGLAFSAKEELGAHLNQREEAKKRDHKKLGKELGLFVFSELVGSGLPLWTPKGTMLRESLDAFVQELRRPYGYQKVTIPHITKKALYETSGHWAKYANDLFKIVTREKHEFAMKPMNCPHHTQIFDAELRSYRDMPARYSETTMVYRDEQSGELSGLSRVLAITQDDAHVFCRENQVEAEVSNVWDIIQNFYGAFGFDLKVRLSRRDPAKPQDYLGDPATWERSEATLRNFVESKGVEWVDGPGEAAFYGAKLDFMAHDSIGRKWQVATIQLDYVMPENFKLSCINEQGEKERVVMIHCAIMGSIERLVSVLIEHFAGAFPLWLSPVQASVIPVKDAHIEFAEKLAAEMRAAGLRPEVDTGNDSFGKKIRNAKLMKVPYVIVVGDKEAEGQITLEARSGAKVGPLPVAEAVAMLAAEAKERRLAA